MKSISKPKGTKWVTGFLRNKIFILIVLGTVLFIGTVKAQRFSSEYWHDGTAILLDGTKIPGKIKYDFQQDIIQVEANGEIKPYTAQNFLYFEIQDAYLERPRRFYSLPYNPVNGYDTPRMFEVLVEGKINLLSREEREVSSGNYGFGVYRIPDQDDLIMSYYILKEGSTIRDFRAKKAELLNYMGAAKRTVEDKMKEERWNVKDEDDLIRIVSFYNSLFIGK